MERARMRSWLLPGFVVVLAIVVLGGALRPGYALSYDMVFTPRETLLPWTLGLGGSLPRSVPQDAVVALLASVVPGWIVQKVALLAALILAGVGAGRLVTGPGRWVAATLAVWNPFVAERLIIGHWSLLLAYASLPWAIHAVRHRRWTAAVMWCALAALTPSGGLLLAIICIPIVIATAGRAVERVAWSLAIACVNLPWLVPALIHGGATGSGTDVFALRAEGAWGAILTALSTGGIWNADVVPGSRSSWFVPVLAVVVVAVAAFGWRSTCTRLGRAVAFTWLAASVAGFAVALLSVLAPSAFTVVAGLPGGGLLRDAQKLLAPMAMLLAVLAGAGITAWAGRWRERTLVGMVVAAAVAAPIAVLPDLAWGALGRLQSVDYPSDFAAVRTVVAGGSGDVVSLPWSSFRDFPWNARRTVLDPMPRFLTTTVLTDDTLWVRKDGVLVPVGGEDPRSAEVGSRLRSGEALAGFAPALGVEFAVVAHGVTGSVPAGALAGATAVYDGVDLSLYRLGEPDAQMRADGWWAVIGCDRAVVAVLIGLAVTSSAKGLRRRVQVLPSDQSDEEATS